MPNLMAGLKDSGNKPTRKNACCNRQWLSEPTELGEGNNHVAERQSACSVSKLTGDFCFVTGHLYRPFFKKRGGGKGDWGSPGDEIVQVMVDPLDPMYDDWPDEELHAALLEHLSSQSPRALTPSPSNVVEEGRLLHVILEAHADEDDYTDDDWQHEYLEVDCDVKPDPMLSSHVGFSESPNASWLHGFNEPTPLKLPCNAMWIDGVNLSSTLSASFTWELLEPEER